MYCKNCGHEIPDASIFCKDCGSRQTEAVATSTPQQNNQKLRNFKKLRQCTCLDCGYQRLMGIVGYKHSAFIRYSVRLLIVIVITVLTNFVVSISWWATMLVYVVAFSMVEARLGKQILFCPNCEKNIIEN